MNKITFLIIPILLLLSSCESITHKDEIAQLKSKIVTLNNEIKLFKDENLTLKEQNLILKSNLISINDIQEQSETEFKNKEKCNNLFLQQKDKFEYNEQSDTKYGTTKISSVEGVKFSLEDNTCYVGVNRIHIMSFKDGVDISDLEKAGFKDLGVRDGVQSVADQDFLKIDLLNMTEHKMNNYQELKDYFN